MWKNTEMSDGRQSIENMITDPNKENFKDA